MLNIIENTDIFYNIIMQAKNPLDAARGAIFGAFVGDALGSYIEFKQQISNDLLLETLQMPGGGPFKLGQGQVTDDSELAICMLRGLIEGGGVLNLDFIANYYGKWVETGPFDIGNTTRNALEPLVGTHNSASTAINAAREYNRKSHSNGCLMRATPICVWSYKLNDQDLLRAVCNEVSLTHSNQTVQYAVACYAAAIRSLINNLGDRSAAYRSALNLASRLNDETLNSWIDCIKRGEMQPGNPHMGYVKIAFVNAFIHLISNTSYIQALAHTLQLGGDTDTNACIVGGLIGAAEGFENIPRAWRNNVRRFTFESKGGRQRPPFLNQTEVLEQVGILFNIAPDSLTCVIDEQVVYRS
jgi:ADP-ribosylglycohydrolase